MKLDLLSLRTLSAVEESLVLTSRWKRKSPMRICLWMMSRHLSCCAPVTLLGSSNWKVRLSGFSGDGCRQYGGYCKLALIRPDQSKVIWWIRL